MIQPAVDGQVGVAGSKCVRAHAAIGRIRIAILINRRTLIERRGVAVTRRRRAAQRVGTGHQVVEQIESVRSGGRAVAVAVRTGDGDGRTCHTRFSPIAHSVPVDILEHLVADLRRPVQTRIPSQIDLSRLKFDRIFDRIIRLTSARRQCARLCYIAVHRTGLARTHVRLGALIILWLIDFNTVRAKVQRSKQIEARIASSVIGGNRASKQGFISRITEIVITRIKQIHDNPVKPRTGRLILQTVVV